MTNSECCTCGYTWETGQDGGHQCAKFMMKRPEYQGGTKYVLDASIGEDGVILFDGHAQSNCRVLCELSKLQAEISRLKAAFRDLGTYVNGVAINYE